MMRCLEYSDSTVCHEPFQLLGIVSLVQLAQLVHLLFKNPLLVGQFVILGFCQ